MTTVKVCKNAGLIVRIELSGHSGYAAEGEDIVCAAVTSAVRYAEAMLNGAMKLRVSFETDPETAFMAFNYPVKFPEEVKYSCCAAVFTGFEQYMKELSAEYPNYIKVMEVQQNA